MQPELPAYRPYNRTGGETNKSAVAANDAAGGSLSIIYKNAEAVPAIYLVESPISLFERAVFSAGCSSCEIRERGNPSRVEGPECEKKNSCSQSNLPVPAILNRNRWASIQNTGYAG